jgi:hypothetical protein
MNDLPKSLIITYVRLFGYMMSNYDCTYAKGFSRRKDVSEILKYFKMLVDSGEIYNYDVAQQ